MSQVCAVRRPNLKLQRELLARGLLKEHIASLGLDSEVHDLLAEKLAQPYRPLMPTDLGDLELPLGLGGFLGCDAQGCASYMSAGEEAANLEQSAGVFLVDPVGRINSVMTEYRVAVAKMLLLALLAAMLSLPKT